MGSPIRSENCTRDECVAPPDLKFGILGGLALKPSRARNRHVDRGGKAHAKTTLPLYRCKSLRKMAGFMLAIVLLGKSSWYP